MSVKEEAVFHVQRIRDVRGAERWSVWSPGWDRPAILYSSFEDVAPAIVAAESLAEEIRTGRETCGECGQELPRERWNKPRSCDVVVHDETDVMPYYDWASQGQRWKRHLESGTPR